MKLKQNTVLCKVGFRLFIKTFVCLIIGICVLPSLVLYGDQSLDDRFRQSFYELLADRLYDSRAVPENLELAIKYYKLAGQYTGSQSLDWKITRCYWLLAQRSIKEEEQAKFYNEGIRFGKLAIKNDKNNSNAHLWYSLILGANALDKGVMNSLYYRDTIKSGLETALKINPQNTNAYIGLASWYYWVPALFGGNRQEAFQLIDKAISNEPNYTKARMVKAEFFINNNDIPAATKVLKKIIQIEKPTFRSDSIENKAKAKKMLEDIKNKNPETLK